MSKILGVDLGTMFFQTAEESSGGNVSIKTMRNAFVEIAATDDIEDILKQNSWQYVKDGKHYYVLGEDSLRVANMFPGKVELRRPLQDGVLNKGEEKKMLVLSEMIKNAIGKAPDKTSVVCTCVSSPSVDDSPDSAFHKARISGMLQQLGYNVKVIEEGHAVVLGERPSITEIVDGKEVERPYSGIGISCLLPHVKIYTKRGIIPISKVVTGDLVLTHQGRWRAVTNVIVKDFEGISTNVQLQGYSDNTNEYGFVDNHELYVYRNGRWQWIGCESLEEKDIVGEPIVLEDVENDYDLGMSICERITCSSTYTKKRIEVSSDVHRLLGYFLGDGNITRGNNDGICFNFGPEEIFYANDVQEILKKNFGKESTCELIQWEGSSKLRVSCYSKGLGNYFRNHFYDSNGEKIFPWCLSKLRKTHCLNLLIGLIRSDGDLSCGDITFGNTSTNLIILVKQILARLGYCASVSWRSPRSHKLNNSDRIICGKKNDWSVTAGSRLSLLSLQSLIETVDCSSSMFPEKMFINGNFASTIVQKIEYKEYEGPVYDIQVDEDHSFSGPYLTIHNCGAGRTNCVLAYKGMQVLGMSCARGGDWIDQKVSEATGAPISQVTKKKEVELDFGNLKDDDDIIFALNAYYTSMIEFVFSKFSSHFQKVKSQFEAPLEVVVAGGTSMPKGFCDKVSEVISSLELPFVIKSVRHAKDPRNAVVKGCLTYAASAYRKMQQSKDDTVAKSME